MQEQRKIFPWKLFNKIIFNHFVIFLPLSLFIYFLFHRKIIALTIQNISLFFFFVFLFSVLWAAFALAMSLSGVIEKAKRLALRKPLLENESDNIITEFFSNEPGEVAELDLHLNQIGKNLAEVDEQFAKELSELETLMSTVPDAIIAVDERGNPLFFNSHFAVLYNLDLGKGKRRLTEIIRSPEILAAFERAIREKNNTNIFTVLQSDIAKEPRYFSVSVSSLLNRGSSQVYGAIGIFHDITELKRAEKIRIDFVSNVSHELRTPLTSIKGYCDLLREDLPNEKGSSELQQHLSVIQRNVDRLMSLVSDLLDLSAIEFGQVMAKESFAVKELSERVLSQLLRRQNEKQYRISIQADGIYLTADPKRIEQVLVNLLDNAMKYTPSGSEIAIHWYEKSDKVFLSIADNGPGIEPTHLPRLFERFYRVDKGRSREMGGTGLGLAIVKHIIQAHGGTVQVESELGKGTKFICAFPKS